MDVTVRLQGALGGVASKARGPVELAVPDGATVADLLQRLTERLDAPLGGAADRSARNRLARSLRVFVNGELARGLDRPLCARGTPSASVLVVVMAPMMGG
jgi:hypothetical protein